LERTQRIRRGRCRAENGVHAGRAEYWYTPAIHFAVREGHLEAVRLLLEAGGLAALLLERGGLPQSGMTVWPSARLFAATPCPISSLGPRG